MADTPYTYSLATHLGGAIHEDALTEEIHASNILTALRGIATSGDVVTITFKAALSVGDETLLDTLVSAHDSSGKGVKGVLPVSLDGLITNEGRLEVSSYPAAASRVNFVTHRWNDATTWYSNAVKIEDETPTPLNEDGSVAYDANTDTWNGRFFQLGVDSPVEDPYIIDVSHGKIFLEDYLVAPDGGTYHVEIKINGEEVAEIDPDTGKGSWKLDYQTGKLEMRRNIREEDVITASYYYATDSRFVIKPQPGKLLEMRNVEVQFTTDMSVRDTMEFTAYGYAVVFRPDLVASGDKAPTDLVPLRPPTRYKTLYDYANESNGVYPIIPESAASSTIWRDATAPLITFPWNYQSLVALYSAYGMCVELRLLNDRPYVGTFATATFYCYSKDDPNA